MIKTIDPLLDKHNFKNYDIKALNLLFSLIKTHKGEERDLTMLDVILNKVLSPLNFKKVFKPFKRQGIDEIVIKVDRVTDIKVDKSLQRNTRTIRYIKRNIELATEMCKGFPVLFLPQYKEFLPEKLCLKMITSEDMAPSLKSSLVQFYISSYLSAKCSGISL